MLKILNEDVKITQTTHDKDFNLSMITLMQLIVTKNVTGSNLRQTELLLVCQSGLYHFFQSTSVVIYIIKISQKCCNTHRLALWRSPNRQTT